MNVDHSSVYLLCDNALVEECLFEAENLVSGACYELHGNFSSGRRNKSANYYRGFWLASDFDAITTQSVEGDDHREVVCSFDIAAPKFGMDNISILNSSFRQSSRHAVEDRHYFTTSHTVKRLGDLEIRNCTFSGNNSKDSRFMSLRSVVRFSFLWNTVANFNDGIEGYGIVSSNEEIGDGLISTEIDVSGNTFMDLVTPISIQPSRYGVGSLQIRNNKFYSRTVVKGGAVKINLRSGNGEVSGNEYHRNYVAPCVRIAGSSAVRDMDDLTGSLAFQRIGMPVGGEARFEVPVLGVTPAYHASLVAKSERSMINLQTEIVSAGVVIVTAVNKTGQGVEFGPGVLEVVAAKELPDEDVRDSAP